MSARALVTVPVTVCAKPESACSSKRASVSRGSQCIVCATSRASPRARPCLYECVVLVVCVGIVM